MRNFYLCISWFFMAMLFVSVIVSGFQILPPVLNPSFAVYFIKWGTIVLLFIPLAYLSILAVINAERE